MGGQFSGNGMTFCPHPIRRCGIETGAIETSSAMGGGFPAGRVFPHPVWRFESGSGAIETLSKVGGWFFGQVLVLRAGGLLRGQVCGEYSLPSEWLSGQGVGSPRPVWFCGVESGVIQASAVMGGRCSGEARCFRVPSGVSGLGAGSFNRHPHWAAGFAGMI